MMPPGRMRASCVTSHTCDPLPNGVQLVGILMANGFHSMSYAMICYDPSRTGTYFAGNYAPSDVHLLHR